MAKIPATAGASEAVAGSQVGLQQALRCVQDGLDALAPGLTAVCFFTGGVCRFKWSASFFFFFFNSLLRGLLALLALAGVGGALAARSAFSCSRRDFSMAAAVRASRAVARSACAFWAAVRASGLIATAAPGHGNWL